VETVLEPWWRRPCANRIRAALAEADRRCHGGIEPDAKTTTSGDDANVAMERAT
jgi:hypothetical protein